MSDVVIKVKGLGKRYYLGEKFSQRTLADSLKTAAKFPLRLAGQMFGRGEARDEFWALKDVSFEVKQGEVLGIIGRNGAGKSTLLKILSRIVAPTTGEVEMTGRVGSLLEVGTGFHPELTGRENIFMNGALLGMRRLEINRKFDEIVAFSGVEKFIDTPVKFYSSGMYTRLAFSVAAHLDPEILIVDEVLAVGDAEFQKKCLGKMDDIAKSGRTILFVSHNMAAVKSLCSRALVLISGSVSQVGVVDEMVTHYLKAGHNISNHKISATAVIEKDYFHLLEIGIRKKDGDVSEIMRITDELEFFARYKLDRDHDALHLTLHFKDEQGNKIFSTSWSRSGINNEHTEGEFIAKAKIPADFFNWGNYFIDLYVIENGRHSLFVDNDIISFTLANKEQKIGTWMGREPGSIKPTFEWSKEKIQ